MTAQLSCSAARNSCDAQAVADQQSCIANAGGANDRHACTVVYTAAVNACTVAYNDCNAQVTGYISPKFFVVGVTYAPPGPNSFVQYTNTSALSSTTSVDQTFQKGTTVTVSVSNTDDIPGFLAGKLTATSSTSFTQATTGSNAITISQTSQRGFQLTGPANPYLPVNHDYDVIWVWINPVEVFTVNPNLPGSIIWNGYGFDKADPLNEIDVQPFYVGYLNGDFGTSPYAAILARNWASGQTFPPGQGPGITAADIATILQADPYATPSQPYTWALDPNSYPPTTTDGRFTLSSPANNSAQNFSYTQPPPGGGTLTETYSNSYSTLSALGQSSTTTSSQTFGVDANFGGGGFITAFNLDISSSSTVTWTTKVSSLVSTTTGQTDSLSITGPPCNSTGLACVPLYTSPTTFGVYQDNLYGTFLFHPY